MPEHLCMFCQSTDTEPIVTVGHVCEACYIELSKPMLLEGVISGISIIELAVGIDLEFNRRRNKLIQQAQTIIANRKDS